MTRTNGNQAFWADAADYGRRAAPQSHVTRRRWLPSVKLVAHRHSYDLMIWLPAARRRALMIPLLSSDETP